jgi:hypothetical protein
MKIFTFAKLGRTLLIAAAVGAVCWLGCGSGGGGNPADDGGNNSNNGGNNSNNYGSHDSRLVNANGEAWVQVHEGYSCASPKEGNDGIVFKSNGDLLDLEYEDGVWTLDHAWTWQTNGNKLTTTRTQGDIMVHTYEVSNNSLTLVKESGSRYDFKKCSGVVVGG